MFDLMFNLESILGDARSLAKISFSTTFLTMVMVSNDSFIRESSYLENHSDWNSAQGIGNAILKLFGHFQL